MTCGLPSASSVRKARATRATCVGQGLPPSYFSCVLPVPSAQMISFFGIVDLGLGGMRLAVPRAERYSEHDCQAESDGDGRSDSGDTAGKRWTGDGAGGGSQPQRFAVRGGGLFAASKRRGA